MLFNANFGFASFIDTIKEMRYRLCIYNRVCIAEKAVSYTHLTHDPQAAECSLLELAVCVSILQTLLDRVFGYGPYAVSYTHLSLCFRG